MLSEGKLTFVGELVPVLVRRDNLEYVEVRKLQARQKSWVVSLWTVVRINFEVELPELAGGQYGEDLGERVDGALYAEIFEIIQYK